MTEVFDACCAFDKIHDLEERLRHRHGTRLSSPQDWPSTIISARVHPLSWPAEVLAALKAKELYFFNAYIFPEMEEVCITINSRLYFWSLHSSSDNPEARLLRLKKEGILAVTYTPLRNGFSFSNLEFAPRHILTLTTTNHVLMVGLFGLNEWEPIPGYHCSAQGHLLRELVSTRLGRVFCGGDDGHLYEVLYYTTSGFLYQSAGLQLVKQTWWLKDYFFDCPTVMQVDALVVDDERYWLYLLRKNSTITLFTLGEEGLSRPQRLAELNPNKGCPSQLSVISLTPIPLYRSENLVVLCTLQNGMQRFYAASTEKGKDSKFRMELTDEVKMLDFEDFNHKNSLLHVLSGFDGAFTVSTEASGKQRHSSMTHILFNSPREEAFQELSEMHIATIEGRPMGIFPYRMPSLDKFEGCELVRNDYHLQLFVHNVRYALLTREKVLVFDRMFPATHLRWILRTKNDHVLHKFVEFHGSTEVAAMAWYTGAEQWDLMEEILTNPEIFKRAELSPDVEEENVQVQGVSVHDGDATFHKAITHSDMFKGFCLVLVRMLQPIWKRKLFTDGIINWKYDLLMFYQHEVKNLGQVATRALTEPWLKDLKATMMSFESETSRIAAGYEIAALRERKSFLSRCFEAIQLLMFLVKNHVHAEAYGLSAEALAELKSLEFKNFLQYRTSVIKLVTGFCESSYCTTEQRDEIRKLAPSYFCPPSHLDTSPPHS